MSGVRKLACLALAGIAAWAVVSGCRSRVYRRNPVGTRCETTLDCRVGLECQPQTGTCQVEGTSGTAGAGNPCETSNDCPGDTRCQASTNTCQVLGEGDPDIPGPTLLGDGCTADEECDEGLVCQFASETCQPPGGENVPGIGASCITNGDCQSGLVCQDESDTCQLPPEA
ncbi:MAG: hypothetical protein JXB13_10380 [Phycisphaerae bacterium]|nr:hypothetical protein [Phycisphaerae bacterium]